MWQGVAHCSKAGKGRAGRSRANLILSFMQVKLHIVDLKETEQQLKIPDVQCRLMYHRTVSVHEFNEVVLMLF